MADGSIRFSTLINTEGFRKGISTLKKAADRFVNKINQTGKQIEDSFNKSDKVIALESQIDETAQTIERLVNELKEMEKTPIPTEEYKEMSKAVEKTQAQLDRLLERQKKMSTMGTSENSKAWKGLQYDIDAVSKKLQFYKSDLQDTIDRERAFQPGSSSTAYKKKAEELARVNDKLYMQKQQLNELVAAEAAAAQETETMKRSYEGFMRSTINGLHTVFSSVMNAFKAAPVKLFNGAVSMAKFTLKGMLSVTKKVASWMKNLGLAAARKMALGAANAFMKVSKALLGIGKSAKKGKKGFSMLGMLGKSLMFSMVFKALSSITNAFKEGIRNFAQYSGSFNTVMSSFTSSLSQLKNTFASAFSPLTSAVIPVLDALIQKLIQAINVIGQFLAALSGKNTFTKAVKVNKDYAASLKNTGDAAKKVLAPFDDLVQIQNESGSSSSGAGSADPSQMFTEETITSGISGFANKIREMLEAGDWNGIGQLVGEKVNEAVQSFTDYIKWDSVGVKITSVLTAFTTMFNSLASEIDWYSVGLMIGSGMDTIVHTLYLFLTQMDWSMLGAALASGLNGIADMVDWNLFGATIGAYFQARISGLYGFVSTVDWPGIGQAIGNSLNGLTSQIDWEMLGLTFADGLSGVFEGLSSVVSIFDWFGFGNSIALSLSTVFQNFDWAGAGASLSVFVVGLLDFLITVVQQTDWASFVQGIVDCIEAVDWIGLAGKIFTLLSSALGVAFGALANFIGTLIADGVTAAKEYFQGKIEECGGNVWLGIAKGISDAMKGINTWIYDNIFKPFIDGFKNAFGIHSPSTVMAEMGQYLWDGFCDGIKEFFSDPTGFIKSNITDPFVKGIKSLLGIHSPSTVLEDLGGNTVAGFNLGVEDNQGATQTIIQSWASGVAGWFASKLGIGSGDSQEAKRWAASTMSGFNKTISTDYVKSRSIMEKWADQVRSWFVGTTETQGVNEVSWRRFADNIIRAFADEVTVKHVETQLPVETWAANMRSWFIGTDGKAGINEASWMKFARDIIQAFKAAITGSHVMTKEPMEAWARHAREWFWGDSDIEGTGGMYAAFYYMAKRINEGFADGITDFAHMAKDAIQEWAEEVMAEAEEVFDIHSPSKEFHMIAQYVVKGFDKGILAGISDSVSTARKWLDGVMSVFDGVDISVPVGVDASRYMPKIATGSIVPPRAGEASASMRGSSTQDDMLGLLISRLDELIRQLGDDNDAPIEVVLKLSGNMASLAKVLKPELDKEAARKGVKLVVVGGA